MSTKERAMFVRPVAARTLSTVNRIRPFSARQMEILHRLVDGLTSKEIALMLEIDERTVDYHVGQMCAKAGAWTRRELVVLAIRSEEPAAA